MNGFDASQVWYGDGSLSTRNALTSHHSAITAATPASGMRRVVHRERMSALRALDREAHRVVLRVGGIEGDAVEECLARLARAAVLGAQLLHRLLVEVGAHDLGRDALVVGLAFDEAPAAELRQEPDRVLRLRIVAVAIMEDHVIRIFLGAAVAVVVVALEATLDDRRRAVDVR